MESTRLGKVPAYLIALLANTYRQPCYNRRFLTTKTNYRMSLKPVSTGRDVPNDINVIIEIPAYSDPVKYEMDKETGAMFVDRFMGTAMQYPCNYGYLPLTLSRDGDPVDVLVIAPAKLITGAVVRCRPIGLLKMTDDAGGDDKLLAVPVESLSPLYRNVQSYSDVPELTLRQIAHFFEHYKDLEEGKWVKIDGWFGPEEAKREIMSGVARYQTDALNSRG